MRLRRLRPRAGFTLAELLVAVLLIDVGLLALVAGSAIVVRRYNETRMCTSASRAAANRLQLLSASRCGAVSGAATVDRGIAEYWSAAARGNRTIEVSDSVVFAAGGRERQVVLRTRVPC